MFVCHHIIWTYIRLYEAMFQHSFEISAGIYTTLLTDYMRINADISAN